MHAPVFGSFLPQHPDDVLAFVANTLYPSIIGLYPVHLQRLPWKCIIFDYVLRIHLKKNLTWKYVSMSSIFGAGLFRSKVYMDMTMPGVQNPHCDPWASASFCWTACNFVFVDPMPSTVVIAVPCKLKSDIFVYVLLLAKEKWSCKLILQIAIRKPHRRLKWALDSVSSCNYHLIAFLTKSIFCSCYPMKLLIFVKNLHQEMKGFSSGQCSNH